MTRDRYRSYVIRVRRRGGSEAGPTRLDVEDLLDGGRATVSGDPASSLADSLERLVGPEPGPHGVASPRAATAPEDPPP
jgi:hypothetical protein